MHIDKKQANIKVLKNKVIELIIEIFKRLVYIKLRKIELDFTFVIKHLLM